MAGPSDLEQLLLEYVNETRADPLASAGRYLTSYAPLRSADAGIQSALGYFGVDGAALRTAFAALSPVQPLAWNDLLADAADAHGRAMVAAQAQSHQLPGEAGLGERVTAAGYAGWRSVSENVYAYARDMLYAHAGFMVDWGPGPGGMQDPAGHRVTIMNGALSEVGMSVLAEGDPATPTGPYVVTQDFGTRAGAGAALLGVAYTDRDGNGLYSVGEGRSDLIVAAGGRAAGAWASGGFQLGGLAGITTVTITGGGLSGPALLTFNAGQGNLKADVVNGTTLKLWNAGTATVGGTIAAVQLAGARGAHVTLAGDLDRGVVGGEGADTLVAGGGHDVLMGGAGADLLLGGGGNDHLYGRAASGGVDGADTILGGDGADYIQGNAGADILSGGAGSDRIQGGADADLIHGDDGADVINGNLGDDTVYGDAGNDQLRGGQGGDRLFGGDGDDMLSGDLGDDRLAGGTGADVLTGGVGADLFAFAGGDAAFTLSGPRAGLTDTIADFARGIDRIDLGFAVQAVLTGDAQADLAAAVAHAQALMVARAGEGEVAAVAVGGATYLLFCLSGGGIVDGAVRLAGVLPSAIDRADFL